MFVVFGGEQGRARRRRVITASLSGLCHLALAAVLVRAQPAGPPAPAEPRPMVVALVAPLPPPPVVEPPRPTDAPAAAPKVAVTPNPPRTPPRPSLKARLARAPVPPQVVPIPAGPGASSPGFDEVSEGELAGAGTAGSGSGDGRGCDMTRRLQGALRKDRLVRAAVTEARPGQAIRIWNGAWVRHGIQDGAGLAAVREAILWEVGFAPEACRNAPQRGLIVLSLGDSPGAHRLVVGAGQWRWSDLLSARRR